ncbi:protein CNPPD1 [Phymastichus coffea]|uniref:protein CNPPD1 n=1 Tax=Phymastichus coffea TaxID=108790 RepID=UPI00273AB950|nr:protein CNPPD1 [Phymastichus coffea]
MTYKSKDKRSYAKFTNYEGHDEFLNRISKTLYYTKLPVTDGLSLPVTELAAEIFTEVKNGQTLERLDVEEASQISRNACVSPCSLVLALLYLERLKDCNPEYLKRVAPSELFLVSLMVASKFLNDDGEDDQVFNTEWAYSGDLSTTKINKLEKEFLEAINWCVFVHSQDFWERLQRLERDIAYKEAQKRGWFSYTELNSLLDSIHLTSVVNPVLSISSICMATYAAGLVALLGSTVFATHLPIVLRKQTQSTCMSSLVDRPCSNDDSCTELDQQIENILLDSISNDAEVCNESHVEIYIYMKSNYTNTGNEWDWIIDSVMFWLPNSLNLKAESGINDWKNDFNQNSVHVTKTDFIIESNPFLQYSDNEVKNIVKTKSLDSNFKIASHDWTHNFGYLSKLPHVI